MTNHLDIDNNNDINFHLVDDDNRNPNEKCNTMNSKTPLILLDADGVLFDFVSPYMDLANRLSGYNLTLKDVHTWELKTLYPVKIQDELRKKSREAGFCARLQPYPAAITAVNSLRKLGSVYCVTSPCLAPTWVFERTLALMKHFGFKSNEIVHTAAKQLVRGTALIDDKSENIVAWTETNPEGLGIIWDAPYNQGWPGVLRTSSWDTVIQSITEHANQF